METTNKHADDISFSSDTLWTFVSYTRSTKNIEVKKNRTASEKAKNRLALMDFILL
jgi:hypothetical protein